MTAVAAALVLLFLVALAVARSGLVGPSPALVRLRSTAPGRPQTGR